MMYKIILTGFLWAMLCYGVEQKVLVEYFTDVECSACPRGPVEIKRLQKKFPQKVIPVTFHWKDAMTTDLHIEYYSYGKKMGMPSVDCNRGGKFYVPAKPATGEFEDSLHSTEDAGADVDMEFSFDKKSNTITGTLSLEILKNLSTEPLFGQLYLVEDSVNGGAGYSQKNIYGNSSNGDWPTLAALPTEIPDYQHRWVVREALLEGGVVGTPINMEGSNRYSCFFSYTVPTEYNGLAPDIEQLSLVGFFYQEPGRVVNVISKNVLDDNTALIEGKVSQLKEKVVVQDGNLLIPRIVQKVSVYTLSGRRVHELPVSNTSVNLKEIALSEGIYLIRCQTDGKDLVIKWNNI